MPPLPVGGGMRRAQRLRQRREFAAVYHHGRPVRGKLLVLRAAPNGRPLSRFGFTTPSLLGKAVVRNKVKRRLREAVRSLPIEAGWDVVVNARRGAAEADYRMLRMELGALLLKARLLESDEGASKA